MTRQRVRPKPIIERILDVWEESLREVLTTRPDPRHVIRLDMISGEKQRLRKYLKEYGFGSVAIDISPTWALAAEKMGIKNTKTAWTMLIKQIA